MADEGSRLWRAVRTIAPVEREELAPALWSSGLFFCALCSFYILRPLRDAMGIAGGVKGLPWLFTATFFVMLAVVPLYGWLVARFQRQVFIPLVYRACAAVLLGFFAAFSLAGGEVLVFVARAFFVWTAVFNLFVVAVFWELMADVWRRDQSERVFGLIAAGGSAGALVGPTLIVALVERIGVAPLLLVSAGFLEAALACRRGLVRSLGTGTNGHVQRDMSDERRKIGGGALAAFVLIVRSPRLAGLTAFVVLLTVTATFVYLEQADIVARALPKRDEQTALFAQVDLVVNAISVTLQGLAVGRLIPRIGVGWTLAILPLLSLLGFVALATSPVLMTLVAVQVLRRAADFSFAKPAREVLYTLEGPEAKYKAKHLIDTAVYRGGDLVGAWAFHGLAALGLGMAALSGVGAVLCAPWVALSLMLGRTGAKGHGPGDSENQSPGKT